MKPHITLRRALEDDALLGGVLDGPSWLAWRTVLIAAMGERLRPAEREVFRKLTGGREKEPGERIDELWCAVGRRGGKSRAASVLCVYLSALVDHSQVLSLGERGLVLFLAKNEAQASVVYNYTAALFDAKPMLRELVQRRTTDTISLSVGVDLQIRAASFRGLRGVTSVGCICDEIAYWFTEDSANVNSDAEILTAVRPSLATTGGPLICISSPYARRGELFETWKRDFGSEGDPRILVVHGTSRDFNPSLSQGVIDRAMARSPAAARSEYGAEFREGLSAFLDFDWIERAIQHDGELPPCAGISYFAHIDASGGRHDAFSLSIAHRQESGRVVVDLVKGWLPPFTPDSVVAEIAVVMRRYGLDRCRGDRYGAEWVTAAFAEHTITLDPSELTASELFLEVEPMFAQGSIAIPRHYRLINELRNLERRTTRLGRDQVTHPPGLHDDHANSLAGAAYLAASEDDIMAQWARIGAGGDDRPVPGWDNVPEPEPLILTAANHEGLGLLTRVGEAVVVVRLPRLIGLAMNDASGRMVVLPAGRPLQLPTRLLDAENWLLRDGLRVCKVEYVASDAEIAA